MKRIKIHNGRIITPYRDLGLGTVVVEDGVIKDVVSGDLEVADAEVIDAKGQFIAPGFIDTHTHGGGGHDFMDGTVEAYLGAAEMHAKHGTTLMFPTTLAATTEEMLQSFSVYDQALKQNKKGAQFGGLHLEGPYFSYEQRGAQDPKYLRNPMPEEYLKVLDATDHIWQWSMAPELPGAIPFGRELTRRGIKPAIAHTSAVYQEVMEAYESGFTHLIHFYSGMSTITRRDGIRFAGVLESGFLIDEMTVEIIADGMHVPESLLKLVYDIKGPSKIALVTDSMRGAGMPDGPSILGSLTKGQPAVIRDGVAWMPDGQAFAGSVCTSDRLVRTMLKIAKLNITEALRMMTSTPAHIAGVWNKKGSLLPGKDADIVIFNDNVDIAMTMIGGNIVYQK